MTQLVSFRNHRAHRRDLKFERESPSSSLATGRTLWCNPAAEDFNVENPLQQREVKTTGASQQNFTILRGKHRGLSYDAINPIRRLTRNIYRQR
jgi:hypothetical protein